MADAGPAVSGKTSGEPVAAQGGEAREPETQALGQETQEMQEMQETQKTQKTQTQDPAGPAEPKDKQAEEAPAQAPAQTLQPPPPAVLHARTDSLSIGPPADAPGSPGAAEAAADGVVMCNITLLLPTGARHPYRIDERYLARRSVDVPGVTESGQKDPFSISVYKLKELILREWREDWDGKPASPSSIRLIHFGKLLDDKEPLTKYHFSAEAPNVVHMSVKPAEMLEEDEAGKSKSGGRESRREGSNGCCVIL